MPADDVELRSRALQLAVQSFRGNTTPSWTSVKERANLYFQYLRLGY